MLNNNMEKKIQNYDKIKESNMMIKLIEKDLFTILHNWKSQREFLEKFNKNSINKSKI